jgi:hypothetical protein
MRIHDPQVVDELNRSYPQYQAALVGNDVETRLRLFWASPLAVRFGATENLHAIDEIFALWNGRSLVNLARTVQRLDIVTFGTDFDSVTLEFERTVHPGLVRGRQSQVWVRLPESWRIVAAHVSLLP